MLNEIEYLVQQCRDGLITIEQLIEALRALLVRSYTPRGDL
jgi:hypothetical protein